MDGEEEHQVRRRDRPILLGACIGLAATVVAFVAFVKVWPSQMRPSTISYPDLITIVLAALAVMLAILTLGVGVLAIWGFTYFQKMATETARDHVINDIERGQIRKHLENLVTENLAKESREGGIYRKILDEAAVRYALSRGQTSSGSGVSTDDEDEGDA